MTNTQASETNLHIDLTETISLARCCQWLHQARENTADIGLRRLIDDVTSDIWALAAHIDHFADDVADVVVGALASVEAAIDMAHA